jgi:multiple sugar transport system permease protein
MKRSGSTSVLLLPWVLIFALFWLYPLIFTLYISFTRYMTLSGESTWVGLDNYELLWNDPLFGKALVNTSIFTFGTIPLTTALALLLAVLLNRNIRWRHVFRSAYFLPSVTSLVVLSLIFTNLYSAGGYVNTLLDMVGLPYPKRGWLLDPDTALYAIMAMEVWIASGYYMVLFLAALQAIPTDLYEAAELSGASLWQQFRKITLPMLRPTLLFILVINTIKSFQVFVEIYVMTRGGPLSETTTLTYLVYTNAFEKSNMMGYASAMAYVVFIIILFFSVLQMKLLRVGKSVGE